LSTPLPQREVKLDERPLIRGAVQPQHPTREPRFRAHGSDVRSLNALHVTGGHDGKRGLAEDDPRLGERKVGGQIRHRVERDGFMTQRCSRSSAYPFG
jgi:hypothetical protein